MPAKCYTYQLNRFFLLDAFLCVPFLKGRKYFYGTKRKTKMLGAKFCSNYGCKFTYLPLKGKSVIILLFVHALVMVQKTEEADICFVEVLILNTK